MTSQSSRPPAAPQTKAGPQQSEGLLVGLQSNLMGGTKILRAFVTGAQRQFRNVRVSNVYKSEGQTLQQGWLAELWVVMRAETDLEAVNVLKILREIHKGLENNGAGATTEDAWRSNIVITFLSFGSYVALNPDYPLPHPDLHRRRIFLQCAAEVEPGLIHPILGQTLLQLVNSEQRSFHGEFFAQGKQLTVGAET